MENEIIEVAIKINNRYEIINVVKGDNDYLKTIKKFTVETKQKTGTHIIALYG